MSPDAGARADVVRDLEAVLFAAGRPLDLDEFVRAVGQGRARDAGPRSRRRWRGSKPSTLWTARGGSNSPGRAGAGCCAPTGSASTRWACSSRPARTLGCRPAALETLAIVAYLQPVTRPEIAEVRGVNSDSAVQTLLDRELIAETGRSEGRGERRSSSAPPIASWWPSASSELQELPALDGFALDEQQGTS